MREDEEKILKIIESVQDFGVCGNQGNLVENKHLARVLSERGCICVNTITSRKNLKKEGGKK